MKHTYWIKFDHSPPRRYIFDTFEEMWHWIREKSLREPELIEWMIRE